jgi:hypothetical protein
MLKQKQKVEQALEAKALAKVADSGALDLIQKLKNARVRGQSIGSLASYNLEISAIEGFITECGRAISSKAPNYEQICFQQTNITGIADRTRSLKGIQPGREAPIWLAIEKATMPPRAAVNVKVYFAGSESSALVSVSILRNDYLN